MEYSITKALRFSEVAKIVFYVNFGINGRLLVFPLEL